MKRLFLLASLILLMSACEIHNYPDGSTMYKFPEPEISVVFEPEPEVVVVESPHSVVMPPYYESYCINTLAEECCYDYEYYSNYTPHFYWEVCEITQCWNPYSGYYEFMGEDCWYE